MGGPWPGAATFLFIHLFAPGLFFFFFFYVLFIYGCAESSLLCRLSLRRVGATVPCGAGASLVAERRL